MLSIIKISKSYGNLKVLDINNISLQKGIYWIKGANGSGKSTLLKALAGIIPFSGDVEIGNHCSLKKNPIVYRSAINHAPAEPTYPSFLRGQELITFYSKTKHATAKEVDNLKLQLGIDGYILNACGSYSSGMLKKLSLMLALMGKSDWIFLDEPFTTLDYTTQKSVQQIIYTTKNRGFIITSHQDISSTDLKFTSIYSLKNKTLRIEADS